MKRVAAAAVLLALMGTLAAGAGSWRRPSPAVLLGRTAVAFYDPPPAPGIDYLLVIGSDVRSGDPSSGLSDSLHVLALDRSTGHGTLVGIPRDSWVRIDGVGMSKINASLRYGGPDLTVRTVAELSGLPIRYWALVDFSRFRALVDVLGGVDVRVPFPMHDPYSGADFDPGPHHLDGASALAFARDRHSLSDGDFGRSLNQGRLLLAALKKFRAETGTPLGLYRYLAAFSTYVRSNVPAADLLHLAAVARRADPAHIDNVVLPGWGGSAGGASVVFLAPQAFDIFRVLRTRATL